MLSVISLVFMMILKYATSLNETDNKSSLELQIIISVIMILANVAIVGTLASGFRGSGDDGDNLHLLRESEAVLRESLY